MLVLTTFMGLGLLWPKTVDDVPLAEGTQRIGSDFHLSQLLLDSSNVFIVVTVIYHQLSERNNRDEYDFQGRI